MKRALLLSLKTLRKPCKLHTYLLKNQFLHLTKQLRKEGLRLGGREDIKSEKTK